MTSINKFQLHYNNLLLYVLKQGKKKKIKNKFKINLKSFLKKNQKISLWKNTYKNVKFITPHIGLTSKKKGKNKSIFVPRLLNEKKSLFLLYNWIIQNSKEKSKKFFFYNIIESLENKINPTESFLKKKKTLYSQSLNNIYNLKKRFFYRLKKKKKKNKKV